MSATGTSYRQLPYGTCPACGDPWVVRLDGGLRRHGRPRWCAGSDHQPTEGLLMDCVWCGRLFLSADEGHRFCSEECVDSWEQNDGSWEGWDIDSWMSERRERSEAVPVWSGWS